MRDGKRGSGRDEDGEAYRLVGSSIFLWIATRTTVITITSISIVLVSIWRKMHVGSAVNNILKVIEVVLIGIEFVRVSGSV